MPYILLALGVGLGLYGLYKFFTNAQPRQIVGFFVTAVFVIICIALLFLALTGRLPAALGLLAAIWPMAFAFWKAKSSQKAAPQNAGPSSGPMTRSEALDILGLKEGATEDDIKEAHRRLITKTHPDQQGSEWLAARINQARDVLLKN